MTLQDVKKNPAEFLYLYATETFLSKIDAKSAAIIRKKQSNQFKVLMAVCDKEGVQYADVVKQLNQIMIESFGYKATTILKMLAEGQEVAGKNWSKGIYGIGSIGDTYEGFTGTDITVNSQTGKLMQGGVEISGQTAIYGKNSTTYTAVVNGTTYTSQYNKKAGNYSAGTYTTEAGKTFNPTGKETGLAGFSNIWSSIESYKPMFENILNWLKSLFPAMFEGREAITKKDTVPSQKDGFTQSSGLDVATVGIFAGIAAVVYALLRKKK